MTRSIFDPTSAEMIDEGGRYMTPTGQNASMMPPELTDGVVESDDDARVPLEGSQTTGLPPQDEKRLVEAARDSSTNPDAVDDPKKDGLYPGESPDDEGTISMQDA